MERSATALGTENLTRGVDQASRELRAAVIAVDHAGAERAAAHYVEALQKLWESLPEQERAVSPVPSTAREILAWAREMTILQRTLTADQLRILQKASRYQDAASRHCGLQVNG
jgi:hypothetical protein